MKVADLEASKKSRILNLIPFQMARAVLAHASLMREF